MTLTIYNTLTRRKEPFYPQEPGKLRRQEAGGSVGIPINDAVGELKGGLTHRF